MNIFYTEVDENLQRELNARGRTGFSDRTDRAIDFMVGKIASVEVKAYPENDSKKPAIAVLGGSQMRAGRYMPSSFSTAPGAVGGYLQDSIVTQENVDFFTAEDVKARGENDPNIILGNAYTRKNSFTDTSRRTGPYITSAEINIGDHSMGLLNKATVQFTIPNPQRDLDLVEQMWFRPGRYASINIEYPESALVSANPNISLQAGLDITRGETTNGMLTDASVPNRDKLKELYPAWASDLDTYINNMRRMNAVHFEGLITSFDFLFTNDGSITATIQLTGTSNVYTDVSMYLDSNKAKNENPPKPTQKSDLTITGSREDFYEVLFKQVKNIEKIAIGGNETYEAGQWILPWWSFAGLNTPNLDQYVLVGEPYRNEVVIEEEESEEAGWGVPGDHTPKSKPAQAAFSRYITFGALINFVNGYVLTKISGSVKQPEIVFTDQACYSNYYSTLVSADPDNILLLPPRHGKNTDCNHYGKLIYYNKAQQLHENDLASLDTWSGVYEYQGTTGRYYPSRIFLNLSMIEDIIINMTPQGKTGLLVRSFIESICQRINYATGNAIDLKLVSHPKYSNQLMLMDHNYIGNGKENEDTPQKVIPYSVPMFSNHPNGSVVTDFQFSAKLPESAKNLSYVLNSGDDVSELDIAPYMNFMYNAQNVEQINRLFGLHKTKYQETIELLNAARAKYGEAPGVEELQQSLRKALAEYIKRPHPDFRTTTQMTAPIFPFEASVTLDGIHGFKYGDVLQFEALPMRYRLNTVFSIINVTHAVDSTGIWKTSLRCIMRPNLD